MRLSTGARIDRRLIFGGLAFGAGWGLAGYCPGPALASVVTGGGKPLIFTAAMLAGMAFFEIQDRLSTRRRTPVPNHAAYPSEPLLARADSGKSR